MIRQSSTSDHVSAQTLARWLGVSGKTIYELAKAGIAVRAGGELYKLEGAIASTSAARLQPCAATMTGRVEKGVKMQKPQPCDQGFSRLRAEKGQTKTTRPARLRAYIGFLRFLLAAAKLLTPDEARKIAACDSGAHILLCSRLRMDVARLHLHRGYSCER